MKKIDNTAYYTIGEVAKKIDRTVSTIKNWYQWQEESGQDVLPRIHTLDKKGTRYFMEDDIPELIAFRDSIQYGQMADFNAKIWGERGKEILQRKEAHS